MEKLIAGFLFVIIIGTVTAQEQVSVRVSDTSRLKISKYIYGQFAEDLGHCIYGGFYLADSANLPRQGRIRMDVVDALRKIHVPILRWPGGCFADQYHWRDGVGPIDQRPITVNTTWGMVPDDNSFGTDEFLRLCHLLGCEPYIAGNVGTGTPKEMESWLEYLNYDGESTLADLRRANGHAVPYSVSFWGVGNESWGCGGSMTPEYYSDLYKRYAEFCKDYPGTRLKKIASGANSDDYNWTDVVMKNVAPYKMWGISMHYYTVADNWNHKGSATNFSEFEYFHALKNCLHIEDLINKHSAIMDKYDPEKKVALAVDEWGIWTDVEPGTNPSFLYQQNSLRDALIAGSTLNIFNNHCERVRLACLAQAVNVLQALVLTDKEKMVLTPTYYVFGLYKYHQDARLLPVSFHSPEYSYKSEIIPSVNASASMDSNGIVHITIVNLDPRNKISVSTDLPGITWNQAKGEVLTSRNFTDINTFENPDKVKPVEFDDFQKNGNLLTIHLLPMSVTLLTLK
jgi:alpha-L-arabinofuranosidase